MSLVKRRIIQISIIIVVGIFFIYKLADMFSPGSFAHAETYELNYPEEKVISAIKKFKSENPEFSVPIALEDGKSNTSSHWYKFYFYYKDQTKIVFTWTRPAGNDKTTFAFVGINDGLILGKWKEINNDFGFVENREVKRIFEERILNRIERGR